MSAQQFMELLFGRLPEFFRNEGELRTIWSSPDTRRRLLDGLTEKGFGRQQLAEMQRIIDAESSDPFDAPVVMPVPLARQHRWCRQSSSLTVKNRPQQPKLLGTVLDGVR